MRKIVFILFALVLFSCTQSNLERENEELLLLTKDLTQQVEEMRVRAQMAAAEAREAQAEAENQARLAREQTDRAQAEAAEALRMKAEFEKRLKNCK